MKNVLIHATPYIAVACVFFTTIFCMDGPNVGTLSGSGEIILSVLESRRGDLNHFARCILGSTCKKWNKLFIDDAPEVKKEFMMQVRNLLGRNFNEHNEMVVWHKYGSGWGRKIDLEECNGLVTYSLDRSYLGRKEVHSSISLTQFDFGRPRFDEQGYFVYYFLTLKGDPHEIREGRYNRSIPCRLLLEKDEYCERFMEMGLLTAFPRLLHKCLSELTMHKSEQFKFCDLQKVVISDDYKTCRPNSECKSWYELHEDLREAIDKRYHEQKK